MEAEPTAQSRPNPHVWTIEHEVYCWLVLQTWRTLASRNSGIHAALAWCCADAQGKGEAMSAALVAASPMELSREGCERIAERIGCDLTRYRLAQDDRATQKRMTEPATRARLAVRLRNHIINYLFAPHVGRWARAHFGAVGRLNDSHYDDRHQYVLCYLTARLIANNERYLQTLSKLPRPQHLTVCHVSEATALDADRNAIDSMREYAARAIVGGNGESASAAAFGDTEDMKHTPIRANLFLLKRRAVIDCLRGRRLYLFDGTPASPTIMRKGQRADPQALSSATEESVLDPRAAREKAEERERGRDVAFALTKLIASWPSDRRRAFYAWLEGLTPEEIATELHMSKSDVRRHLDTIRHAITNLRDKLTIEGAE